MTVPLRIRLSSAACRHAVLGSLADTAPEMHVAITQGIKSRSGHIRSVEAPVEAWLGFLSWLQAEARTVHGDDHKAQARAATLQRAHARIAQEFDRLAKHPAYRGIAVRGTDTAQLPAYRCGEGRWWPSPDMAVAASDGTTLEVEAVILCPATTSMNSQKFTYWGPLYPADAKDG